MSTQQSNHRSLNIATSQTRGGSSQRGGRRSNQSNNLTADQKHQFELVQSIKPEWTKERVTHFCEEHNYDGDSIEASINKLFEFDRPAHSAESEEWKTINTNRPVSRSSPTGTSSRGRGRGGATRGGMSDRSIAAQSVNDQKPRNQPINQPFQRRDNRGSSPTNEESTDGKKKYQKVEKPAAPQVQLPVAGKSYAASLGLNKPAAPSKSTEPSKPSTDGKSEEAAKSDKSEPTASVVPAESAQQTTTHSTNQQVSQPESTPVTTAAPVAAPVKTAAQIVAAGPKKPAAKQPAAAPAPTPVAEPVTTPSVVSEEKSDEPKTAQSTNQSTPSPSAAASKPAPGGRMWRKKESSSSPAPVTESANETTTEQITEQPTTQSTEQPTINFATAPLASLSQSIQAAIKPASPQVRPVSPVKAPKSPAQQPITQSAPAPSAPVVPQSVADLLSANDAVILPQHLRTLDSDVQFGFGGKTRTGGPRAPQPKQPSTNQSIQAPVQQQPASPALPTAALGSFPQAISANRFPGANSPLIHGLNSAADQSKAPARPAGIAGLAPSTPQNNLPLSSSQQSPQTQPSNNEQSTEDYQQDLHSGNYAQHNESQDETGLSNQLSHLSTSAGYEVDGYNPSINQFMSGMDTLASPPGAYDPNTMQYGGYEQFPMGSDYSMYAQSGGYDNYNMNYQRNMPNKGRGGFIPQQQRGQVGQQAYGGYRGGPQNYQQQQPINKPQSNMQQQPKKYHQPGPAGINQTHQQQQQPNSAITNPPVNQTSKSPQPTNQSANQAPQQMMNAPRPMQNQSNNPSINQPNSQYNDYSRSSFNKQTNNPVGQQQYPNQSTNQQYNQPKQAPHSPQSYKAHGGPKGYNANKPNNYPQQPINQQYNSNNYSQAGPYGNPVPGYNPYFQPSFGYGNQYAAGVPAGPPGFAAGRYPAPGVPAFNAPPFHGQSGYSSPGQFGGEYNDLQSTINQSIPSMNDPYQQKQQFPGHGDVDPSQAQSGSNQSVNDAPSWQSGPSQQGKKVVGPESDPAAQRVGPYSNLPFNQQSINQPTQYMPFGAAPHQSQPHQPTNQPINQFYPNTPYQQNQQPQQQYQHGAWQPHM